MYSICTVHTQEECVYGAMQNGGGGGGEEGEGFSTGVLSHGR